MGLLDEKLSTRTLGWIGFSGGLFAVVVGVWLPLHQAASHAPTVSVSLRAAIVAPLLIVLGALYAFFPVWTVRMFGRPQEKRPVVWLLHVPLLIVGCMLYLALKAKLSRLGYRF